MNQAEKDTDIVEKLDQAIEALHRDVQKVEIWAGALSAFARPVPVYQPNDDFMLPPPRLRTVDKPPDM
jgi:hypothetical protein